MTRGYAISNLIFFFLTISLILLFALFIQSNNQQTKHNPIAKEIQQDTLSISMDSQRLH